MTRHTPHLIALAVAVVAVAALVGCRQREPRERSRWEPTPSAPAVACPVPAVSALPEATPAWQPVAGRMVVIDAGHGGKDIGASHFGLNEKDINLDLALRTAELLRAKGAVVQLTRQTDVFVPLPERSAFANRHPNATFVSIHVNASDKNPNAFGVETFVLSGQFSDAERSRTATSKFKMNGADAMQGRQALASLAVKSRSRGPALAASVQKALTARLGEPDRGVKTGNLAVLRETYFCPAVLVEVGFVTNLQTAARMKTEDWRVRTSEALAEGIADFLRRPE